MKGGGFRLVSLYDYQWDSIERLDNGKILCGGVGSGKSITSIAYYFTKECGGLLDGTKHGYSDDYVEMVCPKDLYIITTAHKRDTKEWDAELSKFMIAQDPKGNLYSEPNGDRRAMKAVIDSWNNIGKYIGVKDAFFIFDEQRVVGYGAWVKAFLKITKQNRWILLTATPGDTWMDYLPVFIANGYFKNKTDFVSKHVVYNPNVKYHQVQRYISQGKLVRYRNDILVNMKYNRPTSAHHTTISVGYDRNLYRQIMSTSWNIWEDRPIQNASELCYVARRAVNGDPSRIAAVVELLNEHPKVIIFYNYDYELDLLKDAFSGTDISIAEWNGHRHQTIPKTDYWVYLVQYAAGAEGWNCVETDTMIFYSLNYSYKIMVQAAGRIDRMNTPFTDLYYYRLKSSCPLDMAISRALTNKRNFNESKFVSH